MRRLRIELHSSLRNETIVLGDNSKAQTRHYKYGIPAPTQNDNLTIKVEGAKYAASSKDKGTISIYNLSYATIIKIIEGQYYDIKIYCGYKSWESEPFLLFQGEVAYISNKIHSAHDTECYIVFASKIVAKYSQNRMNFTLNSSINVYTALKAVMCANGVTNVLIDEELKNRFLDDYESLSGTATTILDSATLSQTGDYVISSDSTLGNVIDVTTMKGKRVIKIDPKFIPIGDGNPQISSDGLKMTLLPIYNLRVGDIIELPNSLINASIQSADSVTSTFNTNYMSTADENGNGRYMIINLNYCLENRGDTFKYQITAKSRDFIEKVSGISS